MASLFAKEPTEGGGLGRDEGAKSMWRGVAGGSAGSAGGGSSDTGARSATGGARLVRSGAFGPDESRWEDESIGRALPVLAAVKAMARRTMSWSG